MDCEKGKFKNKNQQMGCFGQFLNVQSKIIN